MFRFLLTLTAGALFGAGAFLGAATFAPGHLAEAMERFAVWSAGPPTIERRAESVDDAARRDVARLRSELGALRVRIDAQEAVIAELETRQIEFPDAPAAVDAPAAPPEPSPIIAARLDQVDAALARLEREIDASRARPAARPPAAAAAADPFVVAARGAPHPDPGLEARLQLMERRISHMHNDVLAGIAFQVGRNEERILAAEGQAPTSGRGAADPP